MTVPLSAGGNSIPVGVAHVFGKTHPDLFVVTSKNSPEQGLFLYEFLELDGDFRPLCIQAIDAWNGASAPA